MAHMLLVDTLIQALQKGEFVIGVFLEFSKVFDMVDHSILLLIFNTMLFVVLLLIGFKAT